jgi:D-3-phosphoglycerate dehydrogenase
MSNTVLLTDRPFGSDEIERRVLAAAGLELKRAPDTDTATLAGLAEQAQGILACYAKVDETVIEAAARGGCRVIARYGIGYDNIAIDAATRAGIVVTYVPDYCIGEVADHTVALLLAVGRAIVRAASGVSAGGWDVPNTGVRRLQGARLALIGAGRIGHEVAVRALSFGMEVVAYDPYLAEWDERLARADSLEQALSGAHFVSLHSPLTSENHHLIGGSEIDLLSDGAVLVNTSRGGLVDLEAVKAALNSGKLSGVGLDVSEPEPLPADHPLRAHPLAVVTPHMSFYSAQAQDELQQRAVTSVVDVLEGRAPRNPVNPEVLAASR